MTIKKEDPYVTLGIERNASDEMIRNAYKRMAKKYHPDKGGNEEDFLRVQEAYTVLSDTNRRAIYDQMGWDGFERSAPGSPGDMPDFFHQVFGGFQPQMPGRRFSYFQMGAGAGVRSRGGGGSSSSSSSASHQQPTRKRVPDRSITLKISLQEAYNGTTCRYRLKRKRYKGKTQNFYPTSCQQCDGSGQIPVRPPDMPNFLIMMPVAMAVCPKCVGLGVAVSEKDMETIFEMLDLKIPKYCPDEYTITIPGKTDELPGMDIGDVIFTVKYDIPAHDKEAALLQVDPPHVISRITVTLSECLEGFSKDVTFVDGKIYKIYLPPYTSLFKDAHGRNNIHDVIRVVSSEGFYTDQTMIRRGDWILHFSVLFPVGDTKEMCQSLGQLVTSENPENSDATIIRVDTLPTLTEHRKDDEHQSASSNPHHHHQQSFHTQECRQS